MPKGQLIQWSDVELAQMATIGDLDSLYEWWYLYMPANLHHYIDVIALQSLQDAPQTQEELLAMLDVTNERQRRYAALFGLGGLLFFADYNYYNQDLQRLRSPRGVVYAMSNRMDERAWAETNRLRDGDISWNLWQNGMADSVIMANLAAYMLGSGFDTSEQGMTWISNEIRGELGYFAGMIGDIISGRQRIDGTLGRRIAQYFHTAYTKYIGALVRRLTPEQFEEYRNILGLAEHCGQCEEETSRGWVPIGMLVPIGQRDCLGNCKCHYEFRNRITGEVYFG